MKKSFIIIAAATVIAVTTLSFTVVSRETQSQEKAVAAQEPSMVKPVINEAQF